MNKMDWITQSSGAPKWVAHGVFAVWMGVDFQT
jgi:hypothetical protein